MTAMKPVTELSDIELRAELKSVKRRHMLPGALNKPELMRRFRELSDEADERRLTANKETVPELGILRAEATVDDFDALLFKGAKAFLAVVDLHLRELPEYGKHPHVADTPKVIYDDNGKPTKEWIIAAAKSWLDGIAGDLTDAEFREDWVEWVETEAVPEGAIDG